MGKKNTTKKASSEADQDTTKRQAEPGKRHRREAALVEVNEAPPLAEADKGTLHIHTEDIIRGSRRAKMIHGSADAAVEAFSKEFIAQWSFSTPYLAARLNLGKPNKPASSDAPDAPNLSGEMVEEDIHYRARASAEYAMLWRPTFLATVALAHSVNIGAKAANVSPNTVNEHRKADPDFDAQVLAAQAYCIELLHSVTMRSALEGDIEPVYWQGIRVDWIRKFDNRLRVELLRAHMPQTFKTPGSRVNVNTGNQLFLDGGGIVDQEKRQKLQEMRQISLARIEEKMANAREVGTPALPPVPPPA